ncbi:MAG: hypothetical protein M3281_06405 [Chloroflexota bacterium]|nr:hypothetical protein [Chloroflexota bacterium]
MSRTEVTRALSRAGFEPAPLGQALLSGSAYRLLASWCVHLSELLEPFAPLTYEAPLLLDRALLDTAGYSRNFPQQVIACGGVQDCAGDGLCLTPAACLHVYPRLAGRDLRADGAGVIVRSRCARHEGGAWSYPFRLSAFHMLELVVACDETHVTSLRDELEALVSGALRILGLHGELVPATDAFFLGTSEGARVIQKLKGLKREYSVLLAGEAVPVASINYHEDYFGQRFGLVAAGGTAHTCCVAFGLERLVACGLLLWGADPAGWPEALRR